MYRRLAVAHTAGDPPSKGRIILANSGCTQNSKKALVKIAAANMGMGLLQRVGGKGGRLTAGLNIKSVWHRSRVATVTPLCLNVPSYRLGSGWWKKTRKPVQVNEAVKRLPDFDTH